jgi:CDP-diacylglycerol--glycerol-3-phosphate 3-phosphatidyltransferase
MRDSGSGRNTKLRGSPLVPRAVSDALLIRLDRAAGWLVDSGVSANAVTLASLVLAVAAGVLIASGEFAFAAPVMAMSCLGDALDGLVARRGVSSSVGGALLDASVDRYGEFCFLGGLAVLFRASAPVLVLALFALAGSFMVSYASAKAEALGVSAPPGLMRRPERAIVVCAGVAAAALLVTAASVWPLPWWAARAPLVGALAVLALGANASAISRLRSLAVTYSPSHSTERLRSADGTSPAPPERGRNQVAPLPLERVVRQERRESNAAAAPRAVRAR